MKLIKLTRGKQTIVDDEDYDELNKYKWQALYNNNNYYAVRTVGEKGNTLRKQCRMHHVIIGTPLGMETDHINGNGLDNRKANLRVCTHMENGRNRRISKGKRFKGIHKHGNGFRVKLKINKKNRFFGTYPTEREAAWLYNKLAVMYFGKFARLNGIPNIVEVP